MRKNRIAISLLIDQDGKRRRVTRTAPVQVDGVDAVSPWQPFCLSLGAPLTPCTPLSHSLRLIRTMPARTDHILARRVPKHRMPLHPVSST